MEAAEIGVRLRIHGRVHGVWYRGWALEQASTLGLSGWVRNRRDGTVEAVLHGPPDRVRRMVELCRSGPPLARVDRIDEEPTPEPVDPGFRQRPTE